MNAVFQLEQEWPVLAAGSVARALPAWSERQPPLRRFESPRQLLRFLHTAAPADSDVPLLALLSLACDDRLAGRLVLQAILPALKSQSERIVHNAIRRDELWELLLFHAWEAVCCYPIERRRSRVAANLVLQVLHDTTRELHRLSFNEPHPSRRPPSSPLVTDLAGVGSPSCKQGVTALGGDVEAVVVGAVGAGPIAERDAQLILLTRVDGLSLRLIARVLGVGYDALRKRRQRAERQLRIHLSCVDDVPNWPRSDLTSSARPISPAAMYATVRSDRDARFGPESQAAA